jgi:hypothetical protein
VSNATPAEITSHIRHLAQLPQLDQRLAAQAVKRLLSWQHLGI